MIQMTVSDIIAVFQKMPRDANVAVVTWDNNGSGDEHHDFHIEDHDDGVFIVLDSSSIS